MSTSAIKVEPLVVEVSCTNDALRVVLADGCWQLCASCR
jgi:hypothetical protein